MKKLILAVILALTAFTSQAAQYRCMQLDQGDVIKLTFMPLWGSLMAIWLQNGKTNRKVALTWGQVDNTVVLTQHLVTGEVIYVHSLQSNWFEPCD